MDINYTFHSHTFRCGHAAKDIEDYVSLAIKNGYQIYGVSDHVLLPGVSQKFTRGEYSELEDYINKYEESKQRHQNEIEMYLGFECEYSDAFIDYYRCLLKEKDFDYLICGQHCGFNKDKSLYGYLDGTEEGLYRYRDDIIKAMQCGLFMYIAHPDLFFLATGEVTDLYKKITKDIIDAAIKFDAVLEINIHGFLREHNRNGFIHIDYPSDYFWSEASKTNIKIVYGGDFHNPNEIGMEFTKQKLIDLIEKYHLQLVDIRQVYNDYSDRIKKFK